MIIRVQNDRFIVVDDVLSQEQIKKLLTALESADYKFKNSEVWDKVWRLSDGRPLVEAKQRIYGKNILFDPKDPLFEFASSLLNIAVNKELSSVLEDGWNSFSASSNIYPAGTSLSWHDDGREKYGAFSFYIHPTWNVSWGGELFIADHSEIVATDVNITANNQSLDNSRESAFLMSQGMGTYIMPKPNRLVLMAPRTLHMIRRVEAAAGDRSRIAVQGFFFSR